MTADIRKRYAWFRKQGVGGIVGSDAATCLALAKAEHAMLEAGLDVVIEGEIEPWDGDCPAPGYCLSVRLVRPCHAHGDDHETAMNCDHVETLASLGMVGVNSLSDPYLRIIAAELAMEAL